MNIGGRIKQRLEDTGKDRQWLLAQLPELSPQALSNLIVRDSKRSEWDEAIADALGVSVLWLVYGKEVEYAAQPMLKAVGQSHSMAQQESGVYNLVSEQSKEVTQIMAQLSPERQDEVLIFAKERRTLQNAGDKNSTQRAGQ